MKKLRVYLPFLVFLVLLGGTLPSCGRKSGCAVALKSTQPKVKKNGQPKGKASSGLWSKKQRRKMN